MKIFFTCKYEKDNNLINTSDIAFMNEDDKYFYGMYLNESKTKTMLCSLNPNIIPIKNFNYIHENDKNMIVYSSSQGVIKNELSIWLNSFCADIEFISDIPSCDFVQIIEHLLSDQLIGFKYSLINVSQQIKDYRLFTNASKGLLIGMGGDCGNEKFNLLSDLVIMKMMYFN